MSERVQVALQVLVVVGVLAAAVFGMAASVSSQPPEIAERTIAPPDPSLIGSTVQTPTPTPEATPTAVVVTLPPATPSPTPVPLQLAAYSLNGRTYTTVGAPVNAVFVAPFKARVQIVYYQLIDGEFYTGTDLADRPHYPYVNLFTDDGRVMKFRPGADRTDTEILVRSSDVSEGDPLFRIAGAGPSSWHDRYDATVTAQVVVSLETTASVDLDAAPFIRAR
jgi:hypothetical protein